MGIVGGGHGGSGLGGELGGAVRSGAQTPPTRGGTPSLLQVAGCGSPNLFHAPAAVPQVRSQRPGGGAGGSGGGDGWSRSTPLPIRREDGSLWWRRACGAEHPSEEAEGLRLHLSGSSSTRYKGVYEHSGRFLAQRTVDGEKVSLGIFDTAMEAAAAYARAVGGAEV